MVKTAFVIVGISNNFSEQLLEDFKEILEKYRSNTDGFIYLVDCELSSHERNLLQTTFQTTYYVESLKTKDLSPIDALYSVKRKLDQNNVVNCVFVASQNNYEVFEKIYSVLFSPVYNVNILVLQSMKGSKLYYISDIEDVKRYLSCISSSNKNTTTFLHSKLIPNIFVHGYSCRQGGISTHPGLFSLNLCYSIKKTDPLVVVQENRARLARAANFKPDDLFIAKTIHGKDVWVFEENAPKSYDAIITKTPNTYVAAPGADCNMLLFADPITKSCGAAHAGWKGILCGIIQATVNAMIKKYKTNPKNLIVSIGPSLSACCCEFGVEESKKFLSIDKNCVIWKENKPKPFLDLRLAAKVLLVQCGVQIHNIDDGQVEGSELQVCTKCDPNERFYSFRRMGPQFGNQVGFIGFL